MGKKQNKINYHEHDTPVDKLPNISNVASANECTGLMNRSPVDNGELESYQELSSMEIPKGEQNIEDTSAKGRRQRKNKQ